MRREFLSTTLVLVSSIVLASETAAQPGCDRRRDAGEPEAGRNPAAMATDTVRERIRDRVREALMQRARESGIAEPVGFVAVEIDDRRTGRARALPLESQLSPEMAQAVIDGAAADLARWPARENFFTIRLDPVDYAPIAPGEVYVECQPRPLNVPEVQRGWRRLTRQWRAEGTGLVVSTRFLLSREGRPVYVRVVSGNLTAQQREEMIQLVRTARFRPASVKGTPVDVWIELPFTAGTTR